MTGADAITAERAAARVRAIYTDAAAWALYEDALPTLAELTKSGWTQVVLSNHVPELRLMMNGLGLAPYIAALFNSAETGVEKPHPDAFRQVLETLPSGCTTWMIGDSLKADVLAAESAGIDAILVRSAHPQAKRCCQSLTLACDILRTTRGPEVTT